LKGKLTGLQQREFLELIKSFNPFERLILTGRENGTNITYQNVWSLYLLLVLSDGHRGGLENICWNYGYSIEEATAIEAKVLRKMKHPSRLRKLQNILRKTPTKR